MPVLANDAPTQPQRAAPPRALWVLAPLFVIACAIAMRAFVSFSAALPPGMDAAYYPLQARSLIEHGHLAYHDLPLIFAIDAAVAKLIMLASSMDLDAALLLASRLVDCTLQPLAAIPIFAIGLAWAKDARRTWGLLAGLTTAALLATVSLPMLRMTSDFEKNSLGLVWLAAAAWAMNRALARPSLLRCASVALFVALAALTHVAAFGATALLVCAALATRFLTSKRPSLPRLLIAAAACVAVFAGGLLAVYIASPRRAASLIAAPLELFKQRERGPEGGPRGEREPGPLGTPDRTPDRGLDRLDTDHAPNRDFDFAGAPPGADGPPPGFDVGGAGPPDPFADGPPMDPDEAGFDPFGGPPPPRPMMGPPGTEAGRGLRGPVGPGPRRESLAPVTVAVVYAIAALALFRAWRCRAEIDSAQICTVIATVATSLVLACPLVSGEYFMRLTLMAPLPASILLAFLFVHRTRRARSNWPALVLSAASVATVLAALGAFPSPRDDRMPSTTSRPFARTNATPGPPAGGRPPIIDERGADELREMRSLITDSPRTVVLASHGVEWWAGFLMHVPVRESQVDASAIAKYDRVLMLVEARRPGPMRDGPGGRGGPGGMRGPRQPAIPRNARLLYDGDSFRLYETSH